MEHLIEKPLRPRVVIVGAGFGGLAAAKRLARKPIDVTIIDKRNFHLFQPLLYQVATAALSPGEVAWPIRSIFARDANVRVVLGKVTAIDLVKKVVRSDTIDLPYDYLVLATGSCRLARNCKNAPVLVELGT